MDCRWKQFGDILLLNHAKLIRSNKTRRRRSEQMKQLMTKWGRELDVCSVKQEYPRPNMIRSSYVNLNGYWDLCINHSEECSEYDRTILVPFAPESVLSGVGVVVQPDQVLHYRKTFVLPQGFGQGRVLLHFGAVDQECTVYLNGKKLGEHRGGYLPFCFEIGDTLISGENVLTLCVRDRTEKAPYARGKQRLKRNGLCSSLFYTPVSGIWKTVWMESVPQEYVTGVRMNPRFDDAQIEMQVNTTCKAAAKVTIAFKGETVFEGEIETDRKVRIDLPDFKAWSPDEPNLYDVVVEYGEDCVKSYFGMRIFEKKKDSKGILRFYLNKKPFIFNGVLDQGYWPDGILTPPSDEAYEFDIRTLKAMGYNTLRKHIKIEEERFYYLCDQIGMVVWQDMPNGGGEYNMLFVTALPNASDRFARGIGDHHYGAFARRDKEGREQFYRELEGMIDLLYDHPCIALWTPFNEGWGQFDARIATEKIRALDPDRLINEACGWFDQGGGDLYAIHNYLRKLKVSPQEGRVVALTEFGGYACPFKDHTACEKSFGYRGYRSKEELTKNYRRLWEEEIYPNLENGLSAVIYTQVSDVEEEVNGVFTYDREIVKLGEDVVRTLNQRLYDAYEALAK